MHSFTILKASALTLAVAALVADVAAGPVAADLHAGPVSRHRRHHAKKSTGTHQRRGRPHGGNKGSSASATQSAGSCSSTSSSSSGSTSSSSSSGTVGGTISNSTSTSSGNSSVSATSFGLSSSGIASGGVAIGFLPDDGDAGGSAETMASINSAISGTSSAYGWYAQAESGTTFTGSQLTQVMDDVKACNCVFQPAVMPTGGWEGLTTADNSQAVAIANVMKQFTDQGIPVWLRFAHEANYYQTVGTYTGTASDFKEGWATVAAAIADIAPDVKMWWSPNVASASSYAEYAPTDMSTVDLVGIDYYPSSLESGQFVSTMQAFHDTYAVDGRKFAIGETGLGYAGAIADRLSWLGQITESQSTLTELLSVSWFNYYKGYDFRVADVSADNSQFTAKFVSS